MGAILAPAIRVVKQSFPASVDARPGFRFPAGRPLVGAPTMGVYARRDSRFRILPIIGTRAPPGADVAAALFVRISPRLLREIRRTLFSRSRSSLTACDRNSAVYPPFGMRPICSLRLANSTKRWNPLFPAYATSRSDIIVLSYWQKSLPNNLDLLRNRQPFFFVASEFLVDLFQLKAQRADFLRRKRRG